MYDKEFSMDITIGRGTKSAPEFIKGVTVQCKNCYWYGENQHCGVRPSEKMTPDSWCATTCPKQFFKPKGE